MVLSGICLGVMMSILVHACDVNNCIRCFPRSTRCIRCMDGYYRIGGSCSLCPDNCARCHRRSYCTRCKPGYYGHNCHQTTCAKYRGSCSRGCRDGYVQSGSKCVQCSKYTEHCEECSDKYNCTKCASGYNLWSSDDVAYCCSPDTWGNKCQYNCSSNCPNTACDVTNGYCDSCSKYAYGDSCQFRCSAGCNDGGDTNVCDRKEGNCRYGCKSGFIGRHCDRVDGQWGQWSGYGPCSVTCGGGSRSRTRSCDNPKPQNGGQLCNGNVVETTGCDLASCPVDGQWSQWSGYGPCSVTCGLGSRSRTRSCDNPAPQNGGQPCSGSDVKTTGCNLASCQVDGQWSQWSVYGPCSVTCGRGSKSRARSCENPAPQNGGQPCNGRILETTGCYLASCPIDGQWSKWSDNEPCSVTCGRGSRFRLRSCDQPAPQNGGRYCSGNDVETTGCNLARCPVDGSWGQWSDFGPCTVTCGEGSMSRSRTCDQPSPQNGGLQCSGGDVEMTSCYMDNCTDDEGDTGTKPGNAKNKDDEISGGDISSNSGAVVGGVIGSVAVCVVLLVVFVKMRWIQRKQHKVSHQAIYVNVNPAMPADPGDETNGMNSSHYESLHGQSQHNSTYMELQTTEYENLKI